jgi:hypothetical protein
MTRCNGKLRQNTSTSDLIFKSDFLVSFISHIMTLLPGEGWRALIAARSAASVRAGCRSGDSTHNPPFVATTHRESLPGKQSRARWRCI